VKPFLASKPAAQQGWHLNFPLSCPPGAAWFRADPNIRTGTPVFTEFP
tara:strand:- start:30623 stop:30766 length:144 start_codon:yes stop_codon:yes gene_type:complete